MLERPWTEEERSALIDLARAGSTAAQVATKLKRTRSSVLGFAHRQFGGYRVVKPEDLKPLHVKPPKKNGRRDGLSPTGRSLKRLGPEVLDSVLPKVEPLPDTKPVRFLNIGRFQCRYIVSDKFRDPNPLMCAAPVKGTGSWCEHHHRVVFAPLTRKT